MRLVLWSVLFILVIAQGVSVEMAWPQSVLGNKIELFYDGRWNALPAGDVRGIGAEDGEISIGERGQGDEDDTGNISPTNIEFSLNNRNGKYSPRNMRSELYGKIGLNTPVRVSTDIADTQNVTDSFDTPGTNGWPNSDSGHVYTSIGTVADYLVTGGTGVHRHAGVNVEHRSELNSVLASDFDMTVHSIVMEALPTGANVQFALRGRASAGGTDWVQGNISFTTSGGIDSYFSIRENGSTSTEFGTPVPGLSAVVPISLRVASFGRSLRLKVWETADGEPEAWTKTTETTVLEAGSLALVSKLETGNSNALPFDVSVDNLDFCLGIILATGEISGWPKKWDSTGNDVWVTIQASGPTRRLIQGAKPLRSALFRAHQNTDLIGYWDFENMEGPSNAYPTLPSSSRGASTSNTLYLNKEPLGDPNVNVKWGEETTLIGSDPLPTAFYGTGSAGPNSTISYSGGALDTVPASNNAYSITWWHRATSTHEAGVGSYFSFFQTELVIANSPQIVNAFASSMMQDTGTGTSEVVLYFDALSPSGSVVIDIPSFVVPFIPGWRFFRVTVDQNAGNLRVRFYVDEVLATTATVAATTTGQPVVVKETEGGNVSTESSASFGHLAIGSGSGTDPLADRSSFIYDAGINAHAGETAEDRLVRLFEEEGLYLELDSHADDPGTAVGPQRTLELLDLIMETVVADDGIFYELRHALGYGYRTRYSLYRRLTRLGLNYTDTDLSEVPEETDDDQGIRNEIIVSRAGAQTAVRVSATEGPLSVDNVGSYETELSVNVAADSQLRDYGGWRLVAGTWDEGRWPSVAAAMHRTPFTGDRAKLASAAFLEVADIFSIINTPEWLPPGGVLQQMRSVKVFLSNFTWGFEWTGVPAGPWQVAEVSSGQYGRYAIGSSYLTTAVDSDDTELVAYTEESELPLCEARWTEDPGELTFFEIDGFDLRLNPPSRRGGLGGERVHVGQLTRASDAFARSGQLSGSLADTGQTWVHRTGTAADATTDAANTRADFLHGAANTNLHASLDAGSRDCLVTANIAFNTATTTGGTLIGRVTIGESDASNYYALVITLASTGSPTLNLSVIKVIAGVSTTISANTNAPIVLSPNVASVGVRVRVGLVNRHIWAKAWLGGAVASEPDWQVDLPNAASELSLGTFVGFRSTRSTGNATANARVYFDNFKVIATRINPYNYDRFNRTVVDGLGSATVGGAYSLLSIGGTIAASNWQVAAPVATTLLPTVAGDVYRGGRLAATYRNVCTSIVWSCPTPTGDSLLVGLLLRGGASFIECRTIITTGGAIALQVISAIPSDLGLIILPGITHSPSVPLRTKVACQEDKIMMKLWNPANPEPHYWQLVTTDPAAVLTGWVGWRNGRFAASTNVNPVITVTDFRIENPQSIVVSRGMDGAAAGWGAGTDVSLWTPARFGR